MDKKLNQRNKEALVIVEESKCQQQVLFCLKQSPASFDGLYSSLQKFFGTNKTISQKDDKMLYKLLQTTLAKMQNTKTIICENGKYGLPMIVEKTKYPKTAIPEEKFAKIFLERLCNNGGAFFEKFVASLLEKYYLITGKDVQSVEVCGGSDDGGIDVIIDTLDDLGFVEHILVQAKCRKTIQVTEKEVREFFGAMNAEKGTRGIYITTSSFHPCAQKLFLSIPNYVGIDGEKIFNIVKKTAYGIKKNKDGYLFDDRIFDV